MAEMNTFLSIEEVYAMIAGDELTALIGRGLTLCWDLFHKAM